MLICFGKRNERNERNECRVWYLGSQEFNAGAPPLPPSLSLVLSLLRLHFKKETHGTTKHGILSSLPSQSQLPRFRRENKSYREKISGWTTLLLVSRGRLGMCDRGTPAEVPPIGRFQQPGLPAGFSALDRAVGGIILVPAGTGGCSGGSGRYEVSSKPGSCTGDRLEVGNPFAKIFFRVVEDLTCLTGMCKRWARVTGNYRGIIKQV